MIQISGNIQPEHKEEFENLCRLYNLKFKDIDISEKIKKGQVKSGKRIGRPSSIHKNEILSKLNQGIPIKDIASFHNVSEQTVRNFKSLSQNNLGFFEEL